MTREAADRRAGQKLQTAKHRIGVSRDVKTREAVFDQDRVAAEASARGLTPAFEGTGMRPQAFNTLVSYAQKVSGGRQTTQQEDLAYALEQVQFSLNR